MSDANRFVRLVSLALALLGGCMPTLRPGDDPAPPPRSGAFTHEVALDGVTTTIVDATSQEQWRHLDLDTGLAVDPAAGWDLAFLRFRVRSNGGESGRGGVFVARMDGDFDAITRAPDDGWAADAPDSQADDDAEPDNAFNNGQSDWYAYDEATHTLTTRGWVYAVASTERRFFKLELLDYYDDAGSPGFVRFRWAEIHPPVASTLPDPPHPTDPPDPPPPPGPPDPGVPSGAVEVDARDPATWVYYRVGEGVVSPAAPVESAGWDLAFRRTEIRTNSGSSGPGLGGARLADADHDELTDATTFGYASDDIVASERPGAEPTSLNPSLLDWYDYDPSTHRVAPKPASYLVRTAAGGYARFRIWAWENGTYRITADPLPRRVDLRALEVDASADAAWIHLSLRDGALIDPDDPATDLGWDVAISGPSLRTNGGTSGAGAGGAVEVPLGALGLLDELPATGWVEDLLASPAGPPGAPETSLNQALSGWFDYDPVRHATTPRPVVYGVRTADGQLAALRVRAYAAGVYQLEIAFAGPGRARFAADP